MKLGLNLGPLCYWSTAMMLSDPFKVSQQWTQRSGTTTPIDLQFGPTGELLTGWPMIESAYDAPYTAVFNGTGGRFKTGTYTFTADGDFDVYFSGSTKVSANEYTWDPIAVDGVTYGPYIFVTRNNPDDLLRNAHFYSPGCGPKSGTWLPEFIDRIKSFNTLRFMNILDTTNVSQNLVTWCQRQHMTDVRWTEIPFEALIELANATGVNPWINIPFSADTNFIKELATLFMISLSPNVAKIYLEYSNETWNDVFEAYQLQKDLYPPGNTDNYWGYTSWTPYQAGQIFQTFMDVFDTSNRLVRVLSGQFSNPDLNTFILEEATKLITPGVGPYSGIADAFAVAPYFSAVPTTDEEKLNPPRIRINWPAPGPRYVPIQVYLDDITGPHYKGVELMLDSGGNPTQTIAEFEAALATNITGFCGPEVASDAAIAANYGLPLIAYEGGQGLASTSAPVAAFFQSVNEDQGMYQLYMTYFVTLTSAGLTEMEIFSDTFSCQPSGCWGIKEADYPPDPTNVNWPKARAVQLYMSIPEP